MVTRMDDDDDEEAIDCQALSFFVLQFRFQAGGREEKEARRELATCVESWMMAFGHLALS